MRPAADRDQDLGDIAWLKRDPWASGRILATECRRWRSLRALASACIAPAGVIVNAPLGA